jgi:hypothetical protein
LGADTDAYLANLAGLSPSDLASLREKGII